MNSPPLSTNFCPSTPTKPVAAGGGGAAALELADAEDEDAGREADDAEEDAGALETLALAVAPGMHCE